MAAALWRRRNQARRAGNAARGGSLGIGGAVVVVGAAGAAVELAGPLIVAGAQGVGCAAVLAVREARLVTADGTGDRRRLGAGSGLRLRDHLVDVQLQSVTADREQHQAALKAALDVAFVGDCVERMDDEARDCRLAAHDAAALVACDVAAAGGAAGPPPEASSER